MQAAFARRSAEDWAAFLEHRAAELCSGGRLVVIGGAADEQGLLRPDERARMVVPTWNRRPVDFLAPFGTPQAAGLVLGAHGLHVLPGQFWAAYQTDGDLAQYAHSYVEFFDPAFAPSLLSALDPDRAAPDRTAIAAGLDEALRKLIEASPQQASCRWHVMVLEMTKPD